MGTQLQELGHDAVMRAFVSQVLSNCDKCPFYVLSPALGPRHDVLFRATPEGTYASAYASSTPDFIPEFVQRARTCLTDSRPDGDCPEYKNKLWYLEMTRALGRDARNHLVTMCAALENRLGGGLPDVVGLDSNGDVAMFAEVKFEGLSHKALSAVLSEHEIAVQLDIPYHLAVPKAPLYTRPHSTRWLKEHLPQSMLCYRFCMPRDSVLPKQCDLTFERVIL